MLDAATVVFHTRTGVASDLQGRHLFIQSQDSNAAPLPAMGRMDRKQEQTRFFFSILHDGTADQTEFNGVPRKLGYSTGVTRNRELDFAFADHSAFT